MTPASSATAQPIMPTLLSHLNALTQPSLALPTAYLHPYALSTNSTASGWKGKARADPPPQSVQAQLEMVQSMRSCVQQAKEVLGKREGDWRKLSRAMKEVVTHENTILPLQPSFHPHSPRETPLIPSKRVNLAPVQLLPALAQAQDIQTYHEDSQFGLLKATLTLAGNCFVIDIDLETNAAAEEDDTAPPTPVGPSRPRDFEGSVRLSKLSISYVTSGEGQASEYVTGTLRTAIEQYLAEWNSVVQGLKQKGDRAKRIEICIRRLEGLLGEMKALDGPILVKGVQGEDSSFGALEIMVKRIQGLIKQHSVFPPDHPTICPNFRLFPSDANSSSNPTFRVRPASRGENVPSELLSQGSPETQMTAQNRQRRDNWLFEVVPQSGSDGVVVRRNWLSFIKGPDSQWDGGVKIENLLYKPDAASSQIGPFPYQSAFIHPPPVENSSLDQHWSLAAPGPDGYVVGCIPLPETVEQLERLCNAFKRQLLLNEMFCSVFSRTALSSPMDATAEDEDGDLEKLLEDSRAIPINVSMTQDSIILMSPLPHSERVGASLRLEVLANGEGVEVRSDILGSDSDVQKESKMTEAVAGMGGNTDLVAIYRTVESALRG